MTTIDPTATSRASRAARIVRDWWPAPAFIAGALLAQQLLLSSRYDVGGHAAEHLAGATAPFMAAAVLSILFWATPRARWRMVRNDAARDVRQPAVTSRSI